MRPSWINLILSLNTSLRELEIGLFHIWQRSEDVLLDHGHYVIQVWNDQIDNCLLVLQVLLNFINGI